MRSVLGDFDMVLATRCVAGWREHDMRHTLAAVESHPAGADARIIGAF